VNLRCLLASGCLAGVVIGSCHVPATGEANDRFQDCEFCPEMVIVPPGRILVGTPRGVEGRFGVPVEVRKRSEPVTEVSIKHRLAVGRFEVTRAQFGVFVHETKFRQSNATGCWNGYGRPSGATSDQRRKIGRNNKVANLDWSNPGFPQALDHPVVCVSQGDITSYLEWLSKRTGRTYRLLSESEWNYLASEGIRTVWPWGNDPAGACGYGNFSDMTRAVAEHLDLAPDNVFQCLDGFVHTAPVGSFKPNKYGLHDLFGNAVEVVADCFRNDLEKIPRDGSPYEESNCTTLASKGGSWDIFPFATLTGFRASVEAGPSDRYSYVGFRVAVTLP
jgi:sulfatase modifying factor 1